MKRQYTPIEDTSIHRLVDDVLTYIFLFLPLAMRRWVIPAVCSHWRTLVIYNASTVLDWSGRRRRAMAQNRRHKVFEGGKEEDDIMYDDMNSDDEDGDDEMHSISLWYTNKSPKSRTKKDDLFSYAASMGSLSLFQWAWDITKRNVDLVDVDLYNEKYRNSYIYQNILAKKGHLHILKWIVTQTDWGEEGNGEEDPSLSDFIMGNIFKTGNLKFIQWGAAYFINRKWPEHLYPYDVISSGNREAIKWAFKQNRWVTTACNSPSDPTTTLRDTWVGALRGHHGKSVHFDILKWANEQGYDWKSNLILPAAAGLGRLDIIQWAIEQNCPIDTTKMILQACKYNHLDVLVWINDNMDAVDVEWGEGFQRAFRYNHLDIIKWIVAHWFEGQLPLQFIKVDLEESWFVQKISMSTLKYLFEHVTKDQLLRLITLKECIRNALDYGKRSIVTFMMNHPWFHKEAKSENLGLWIHKYSVLHAQPRNIVWTAKTFPIDNIFHRYMIACHIINKKVKWTQKYNQRCYPHLTPMEIGAALCELHDRLMECDQYGWAATFKICMTCFFGWKPYSQNQ